MNMEPNPLPHLFKIAFVAILFASPSLAFASEVWGGVYVHDVDTALTKSGIERGFDLELGLRGERLAALSAIGGPSPYGFLSAHTAGHTHFAAAGLSWRFGDRVYFRPGIGVAVHTGSAGKFQRSDLIAFGSRVLFEPEIGVGTALGARTSIEASWVHLSHGRLFGPQNPGMDSFGVRLSGSACWTAPTSRSASTERLEPFHLSGNGSNYSSARLPGRQVIHLPRNRSNAPACPPG